MGVEKPQLIRFPQQAPSLEERARLEALQKLMAMLPEGVLLVVKKGGLEMYNGYALETEPFNRAKEALRIAQELACECEQCIVLKGFVNEAYKNFTQRKSYLSVVVMK